MIEVNKKCLECANYVIKGQKKDGSYEYKCGLSKAKATKCMKEIQDYFKEI